MKRLIIISIVLLNTFVINAQKYTPFDFENGIWTDVYYVKNGLYGQPTDYYSTYYTKGDTIINKKKYYKLYYEYLPVPSLGSAQKPLTIFWGVIRNDTLQRQVKVLKLENSSPIDSIERVLYDFNLKIGDTIYDNSYEMAKIISIDSIEICGIFYKRFKTNKECFGYKYSDSSKVALIEGIGYNCGFIEHIFYYHEFAYYLGCYTERGNDFCEKCADWTVNIKEQSLKPEKPEIIYNQQLQELQLTGTEKIKLIKIVSVSGKTIYDWNQCKNNSSLSLTSLRKGIYIVSCCFVNGEVVNKKIAVF